MPNTAGPIEQEYLEMMKNVARTLDEIFNPVARGEKRRTGFALLVFRFGDIKDGRVNYISNGQREDVITSMKELIARFEGRYQQTEGKQ